MYILILSAPRIKGQIIGTKGQNIRHIEQNTGTRLHVYGEAWIVIICVNISIVIRIISIIIISSSSSSSSSVVV